MNLQKNNETANRNFYVLDFLKSLLRIKRIPIIIYLLIDSVFAYLGINIILSFFFLSREATTALEIIVAITAAIIYIGAIALSLSPIGEWVLRLKYNCSEIEDTTILEKINILFDEVYSKSKLKNTNISENIQLFIQENNEANAFAIGRNSICITTGLLDLPNEEIKAVLAHEFGHISNKDTDLVLVVTIANLFINVTFALVWAVLWIIRAIGWIISLLVGIVAGGIADLVTWLSMSIFNFGAVIVIGGIQMLWNCVGSLILNYTSRDDEFAADKFACELGYGEALVNFFKTFPDALPGTKNKITLAFKKLATIGNSHPATYRRIKEIEKLQSNTNDITMI